MKTATAPILIFATFSIVGFVALPVSAAKSPAMEACSKQWDDMKAAGKTGGRTWPSFWSDCSKNLAAKNGTEAAAPEKPAKAEKATPKKAVTSVRNEEDNASSAQQKKDCDARSDVAPMDGTIISNLCPGAFDPNFDAPPRIRSRCIGHSSCDLAKLRVLEGVTSSQPVEIKRIHSDARPYN